MEIGQTSIGFRDICTFFGDFLRFDKIGDIRIPADLYSITIIKIVKYTIRIEQISTLDFVYTATKSVNFTQIHKGGLFEM